MRWIVALCVVVLIVPIAAFAADDPLTGIRDLMLSGQYKEARAQLVKARDAFAAQHDAPGEASALLLLGVTDSSLDDAASARKELDQAAIGFTSLDDPVATWLSLTALAELERTQDHLDEAIAAHERVLDLLHKASDPKVRFSFATMKVLGPVFGMPTDMLGPLEALPELVKPMLLRLMEALSRSTYAKTLIDAGALEKAEEQLAQASAAAAMFGGFLDPVLAIQIGDLRERQWRLDKARDSYLKALNGNESTRTLSFGDPRTELSILSKLSELEILSGRVEEALAWNDRALVLVRGSNNPKREADVLDKRADLLQKAGRYDAAAALYGDLLALATKNGDLSREASVYADLGALHLFQGTYGTSAKHLGKAIELYRQLNEPYLEAPTWILLAEVHLQLDMQDSVAFDLDQARELAKKSGFKLAGVMVDVLTTSKRFMAGECSVSEVDEAFMTLSKVPDIKAPPIGEEALGFLREWLRIGSGLSSTFEPPSATMPGLPILPTAALLRGKLLLDRGDHEAARAAWCQALDANRNNDIRAGLLGLIGASYWNEGNREEGLRYFTQIPSVLEVSIEDVKVEEMLSGYLGSNRHAYYDLLIDMLVHEKRYEEAFAQSERARARAFLQMVGNHRFNAERGADPSLVREAEILRTEIAARELQASKAGGNEAIRLKVDLERARERYRTLLTRVKVSNPEYEALTNIEPLKLEEVRAQLPPDTALISYFVSPRVVHAWVVDRGAAHYTLLPLDPNGLRRIACWAESFGRPNARGVKVPGLCDDAATAEEAFDQLLRPLLGGIRQHRLILIPHGVLHYVPFAALRNRESGHYLIDDFTLTYVPSASVLRFLQAKETPMDGGALILGDPETPLPRLPGAAGEAKAIARTLGATAHLGADAREELLDDIHGKIDLVHLAAHGVYDPVNPIFSRIALAPDARHDGNLTVQKILSSIDLTGVNLVVLSACQSAVGARSSGDEVVGLTRALLYAGTPGVISTLWNIDDAASARLMEEFYKRLTTGLAVADALRQAQLAVKENAQSSDPRYWAAFMLTGDPKGTWKRAE
jgi:CHAT domain-containing protein